MFILWKLNLPYININKMAGNFLKKKVFRANKKKKKTKFKTAKKQNCEFKYY